MTFFHFNAFLYKLKRVVLIFTLFKYGKYFGILSLHCRKDITVGIEMEKKGEIDELLTFLFSDSYMFGSQILEYVECLTLEPFFMF